MCFFFLLLLSCWISREATTKHFALVSLFFLFGFSNHWKNFFFLFNKTLSHVQQFFCTIETRRKKLLRPDGFTFTFLLLSFSIDVHLACFAKLFSSWTIFLYQQKLFSFFYGNSLFQASCIFSLPFQRNSHKCVFCVISFCFFLCSFHTLGLFCREGGPRKFRTKIPFLYVFKGPTLFPSASCKAILAPFSLLVCVLTPQTSKQMGAATEQHVENEKKKKSSNTVIYDEIRQDLSPHSRLVRLAGVEHFLVPGFYYPSTFSWLPLWFSYVQRFLRQTRVSWGAASGAARWSDAGLWGEKKGNNWKLGYE